MSTNPSKTTHKFAWDQFRNSRIVICGLTTDGRGEQTFRLTTDQHPLVFQRSK